MALELWTEKYRPSTVDDYVFQDERLRSQVKNWIKEKSIPHLLLTGPAGTGKSSLAKVLLTGMEIDPGDILYMNASDQRKLDDIRITVQNFASTVPMGDFKVILLEEFDHVIGLGQGALRRIMEDYADNCRFILTGNYSHKIIPAIKSRCQEIIIQNLDKDAFLTRAAEILVQENVELDEKSLDILDTYVSASYPDLRKCINNLQLNTQDGILLSQSQTTGSADWQLAAVELFKKGQIANARKLIVQQINAEEFEDFFRLCYRNLDWWGTEEEHQDEAVLIIRNGMVKHLSSADPEINLSAMLIELARIGK